MSDYPIRFTKDGFHQYRNDYKKSSIQGTHVTFEEGCTHALTVAHVPMVLEDIEKESDNLTNIKRKEYDFKPFTFIDLFAGVGGFRQALDRLGGTCVFSSEIDKFASQAYETLYGEKPAGDITKIDEKDVPEHDLLVGGFPCQSFSVAGKREGFEDTRGTLFFDIARIAAEKRPKALLLENVKGLVNHDKGNTLDTMIRTLNDIGYIVDFDVLNSKYFGVPQNRERIFIVAIREDLTTLAGGSIEAEPFSEESTTGQTIVPKGKRRIGEWAKTFNFDWPEQSEVTTRLRDILESEVDEKYYLDEEKTAKLVAQLEAQEPSVTDEIKCYNPRNVETGDQTRMQDRIYDTDGNVVALTSFSDRLNVIEPQMLGHVDSGGHREPKIAEVRPVLTPDRMEKRQNGRRFKEDGEESFTLTSQDRHGVELGNPPKYRIRKLTPRECWRLQGFPDEAHDAVETAGISDSQRYKQAGNAVTVNVIEAIGERLIPLIS